MTIKDLAIQLVTITGQDVYSLLNTIRKLSIDEARAKTHAREREYAAKNAWRNCNAKYRQIQHQFKNTHTKKI